MKIKVIDLLNKIANGEEVPKRIKYSYETFKWNNIEKKYYKDRKDKDYIYISFDTYALNDIVEIIEEETEINIQGIEETNELLALKSVDMRVSTKENLKRIDKAEIDMFYKLIEVTRKQNKMLKAIKQLDKQIKEK